MPDSLLTGIWWIQFQRVLRPADPPTSCQMALARGLEWPEPTTKAIEFNGIQLRSAASFHPLIHQNSSQLQRAVADELTRLLVGAFVGFEALIDQLLL